MSRLKNVEKTKKIRADIIKAAQNIAEEEGWEAVTMRRLSKNIGYTLPVLYHYFSSKEAIIIHVAEIGFAELLKSLKKIPLSKDLAETLRRYFTGYFTFAITHPALYQAMYGQYGISSIVQENPSEGVKLFEFINQKLEKVVQAGAKIANTRTETKILWSMLHGLVDLHFLKRIEQEGLRVDEVIERYVEIITTAWKVV